MRGTPLACLALLAWLALSAPAAAAPVLTVDGSEATVRDDPFLPTARDVPGALPAPAPAKGASKRTLLSELRRFYRAGDIDRATYARHKRSYDRAKRVRNRLTGVRRTELGAVLATLDFLASDGRLVPTRLRPLFVILDRNRAFWSTVGRLPVNRERVAFDGSEIVWEYYAGQGLQIQPLGTFGKANGLWQAGGDPRRSPEERAQLDARLRALLDEMIPLLVERSGALAWEYYFFFGGGRPPWVSGMATATGLQALSRAAVRLNEARYREIVPRALRLFDLRPPVGVGLRLPDGRHYLQYSFSPRQRIINAFLQSVIGLYETADQLNDPDARRLAVLGDEQARAELSRYDTGAWSLYSLGGAEATLDYYNLARTFLKRLCDRLQAAEYCDTYRAWTDYLREPPEIELITQTATAGERTNIRFRLSKVSSVGVTVRDPTGRIVFEDRSRYPYGTRAVAFTPERAGTHTVRLDAVDLRDNRQVSTGAIEVAPGEDE